MPVSAWNKGYFCNWLGQILQPCTEESTGELQLHEEEKQAAWEEVKMKVMV